MKHSTETVTLGSDATTWGFVVCCTTKCTLELSCLVLVHVIHRIFGWEMSVEGNIFHKHSHKLDSNPEPAVTVPWKYSIYITNKIRINTFLHLNKSRWLIRQYSTTTTMEYNHIQTNLLLHWSSIRRNS